LFPIILQVKSTADKDHTFDTRSLLRVVCGRAFCSAAAHFLYYACYTLSSVLNRRSKVYYSSHVFHAVARLDLPTWDDPAVSSQIAALFPSSPLAVSWAVILTFVNTVCAVVRMCSQTAILFGVLRGQKDGFSFALLTFSSNLASYLNYSTTYPLSRSKVSFTLTFFLHFLPVADRCLSAWAATTRDKNYIRMEGLRRLVNDPKHRKEVVAGGLAQYLVKGTSVTPEPRDISDLFGRVS